MFLQATENLGLENSLLRDKIEELENAKVNFISYLNLVITCIQTNFYPYMAYITILMDVCIDG